MTTLTAQPVWRDEFDLPPGSGVDPAKWTHDLGASGWGNNELQTYTTDRANCEIVEDSEATGGRALVLRAIRDANGGYTSARLKTQGKFSTRHGIVEARLKLPHGRGIWPAFWMLGIDFDAVPWPQCGEIDIMELIGQKPGTLHGTLHGPGYSGGQGLGKSIVLPDGEAFSEGYHTFAVDWKPGSIDWLLDGKVYQTIAPGDLPTGAKWVFDDWPYFMLLNMAVGGAWPGLPDGSTTFPQEYRIDYVRVYARK